MHPGTGTDRDIYMTVLDDDCTPKVPTDYTLLQVSDGAPSQTQEDRYPQIVTGVAPDSTPIYDIVWRIQATGAVWSRFGSVSGPIGTAERISSAASAGYPTGDVPQPVLAVLSQVSVVWVGSASGADEIYYQQTAWESLTPLHVYNSTGAGPR